MVARSAGKTSVSAIADDRDSTSRVMRTTANLFIWFSSDSVAQGFLPRSVVKQQSSGMDGLMRRVLFCTGTIYRKMVK